MLVESMMNRLGFPEGLVGGSAGRHEHVSCSVVKFLGGHGCEVDRFVGSLGVEPVDPVRGLELDVLEASPYKPSSRARQVEDQPASAKPDFKGRALVAEDNEINRVVV